MRNGGCILFGYLLLVGDLTDWEMALCGKSKEAALEAKANGDACFSNGDFSNALRFNSQESYCKCFSIRNHENAINDLTISLKTETSLSGKRQIRAKIILDHSGIRSSLPEEPYDNYSRSYVTHEPPQVELQFVFTPTKGRGMTYCADVAQASLMHKEDPYAVIILKRCRETHCHYCFNELPANAVSCI